MTKRLIFGFILGFWFQSSTQGADGISLERDTNRPGMDYANFELEQANPNLCRQACAQDAQCKAFTYVKPHARASRARCWLKQGVPAPVADDCCVSGTKARTQYIKGEPSPLAETPKIKQENVPGDEFERVPGIPRYQRIERTFEDRYVPVVGGQSVSILCGKGWSIVGGGCAIDDAGAMLTRTRPRTIGALDGWECRYLSTLEHYVVADVVVYAICMRIDE